MYNKKKKYMLNNEKNKKQKLEIIDIKYVV